MEKIIKITKSDGIITFTQELLSFFPLVDMTVVQVCTLFEYLSFFTCARNDRYFEAFTYI